jgi:hypothetical protein
MTESEFTRKLCGKWAKLHIKSIPIAGGKFQPPGLPDRLLLSKEFKKEVFVEFKTYGNWLSPIQYGRSKELLSFGAIIFVLVFNVSRDSRYLIGIKEPKKDKPKRNVYSAMGNLLQVAESTKDFFAICHNWTYEKE